MMAAAKAQVVACGSRQQAMKDFNTAANQTQQGLPFLLVDSEEPVVGTASKHRATA